MSLVSHKPFWANLFQKFLLVIPIKFLVYFEIFFYSRHLQPNIVAVYHGSASIQQIFFNLIENLKFTLQSTTKSNIAIIRKTSHFVMALPSYHHLQVVLSNVTFQWYLEFKARLTACLSEKHLAVGRTGKMFISYQTGACFMVNSGRACVLCSTPISVTAGRRMNPRNFIGNFKSWTSRISLC